MKKLTDAEFGKCFEALFKAYSGRIYNYVLHLSGGDRYKAEEVTQIAFMKLWTKRDEITDMESMQLFAIINASIAESVKDNVPMKCINMMKRRSL